MPELNVDDEVMFVYHGETLYGVILMILQTMPKKAVLCTDRGRLILPLETLVRTTAP